MANQWFKFYGAEYLSDPKMDRLTVQERSCWLTLLCMASQTDGVIKFLSVEGLLAKSGVYFNPYDSSEWDKSKNVLVNFEKYEMIEVSKNGEIKIKNWEKRQEHNLTVAERVAKHRRNKKSVTTHVTSVTTEENRVEENRKEIKQLSSKDDPINFSEEIKKLEDSKSRHLNIVGFYMETRQASLRQKITTRGQLSAFIKRHAKSASALAVYTDDQIISAKEEVEVKYKTIDWTLETLLKELTK